MHPETLQLRFHSGYKAEVLNSKAHLLILNRHHPKAHQTLVLVFWAGKAWD